MTEFRATVKVDAKGNLWIDIDDLKTRIKVIPSYLKTHSEKFADREEALSLLQKNSN